MKPVVLSPGIGDNRPTATLYYGQDVRETLRTLPEASVHTVCTSPPYFGLRDYGTGDKQIGLEDSPEEFVAALVEVFREVKRVLRPDGTLWLNIGDSYAGAGYSNHKNTGGMQREDGGKQKHTRAWREGSARADGNVRDDGNSRRNRNGVGLVDGCKPKDLIGIPWRVAFALQADGWYLRQDIIWTKNNPMPESVTDRCTKSHEYVFLFAHPDSGGRYFYDNDAVKEVSTGQTGAAASFKRGTKEARVPGQSALQHREDREDREDTGSRNKRSVWNVNPRPYAGAHFAVWPPEIVRPMIQAGTSEYGVCADCGNPWKRVFGRTSDTAPKAVSTGGYPERNDGGIRTKDPSGDWEPTCDCVNAPQIPATVLDPFSGSATTGMVALHEGRNYIGIDLNSDYLPLAEARVQDLPAPKQAGDDESDEPSIFDFFEGD